MKKILRIIIIALILCGISFVYKKYVKKEENNETRKEKISINANINDNDTKENKTEKNNESKEVTTQNGTVENNINKVEEQNQTNETNRIQENNSSTAKPTINKIKETLSPSGFMGSSLLRVALYNNGEVYLIRYNGEGYDEKNIENKELIATNASGIRTKGMGEDFEAIVIQGSSNFKVKNQNYSWIEFEQ